MNPIKKNHDALLRTGAMALAAAGASTTAHAATVQITFQNSFISSTSGNYLDDDFGGDGIDDIHGAAFTGTVPTGFAGVRRSGSARVGDGAGRLVGAWGAAGGRHFSAQLSVRGVRGAFVHHSFLPPVVVERMFVRVLFTDAAIRGAAATTGYLDLTASATSSWEKRVTVNRLVFDDATGDAISGLSVSDAAYAEFVPAAVPEPSGLGLLALGAGGLLARRRRAMAA